MPHVAVIGAGVIGLTCAIHLCEAGHSVTIIAKHLPGDQSTQYTSPWAGAHWRTHAGPKDVREQQWDLETYAAWLEEIEKPRTVDERAALGMRVVESWNYWDKEPKEQLWWAPHVRSFASLSEHDQEIQRINSGSGSGSAKDPKIAAGMTFSAIAVNSPQHLLNLRDRFSQLGGTFVRCAIPTFPPDRGGLAASLAAASATISRATRNDSPSIWLNASGLGARELCNDAAMYPIKGQTVLVRGEAEAIRTRIGDGYTAYVIPRPGSETTILGGTKEIGCEHGSVNDIVTRQILGWTKVLAPELLVNGGEFDVLSVQAGLRPARRGGARVESELLQGSGVECKVVHAYGHAGAGFQNSVGVARRVVQLVKEMEESKSRL